ncbi:hypothetical protein [Mycobacterium rhizamassiliense]|nr:hypothetical protein [Mycobacterium rhizamassiliense]
MHSGPIYAKPGKRHHGEGTLGGLLAGQLSDDVGDRHLNAVVTS